MSTTYLNTCFMFLSANLLQYQLTQTRIQLVKLDLINHYNIAAPDM